jgi:hypothetical protein
MIATVPFSDVAKFRLLEWQRDEIEEHSNRIFSELCRMHMQGTPIMIPGQISVTENRITKEQKLIDGNHRVTAIRRLVERFPETAKPRRVSWTVVSIQ